MDILIADDSPTALKLLELVLAKFGHSLQIAEDGDQAWELYLKHRPPVVITDWMMPKLNGLDFCHRLRQENDPHYTYVIVLTARGGKQDVIQALEAGADDFITKPFDKDELRARLHVASRIAGLQNRVAKYEKILPICMYCKKIRGQEDTWVPVDDYLTTKTESSLSHGVCPECYNVQVTEIRRSRGQ